MNFVKPFFELPNDYDCNVAGDLGGEKLPIDFTRQRQEITHRTLRKDLVRTIVTHEGYGELAMKAMKVVWGSTGGLGVSLDADHAGVLAPLLPAFVPDTGTPFQSLEYLTGLQRYNLFKGLQELNTFEEKYRADHPRSQCFFCPKENSLLKAATFGFSELVVASFKHFFMHTNRVPGPLRPLVRPLATALTHRLWEDQKSPPPTAFPVIPF